MGITACFGKCSTFIEALRVIAEIMLLLSMNNIVTCSLLLEQDGVSDLVEGSQKSFEPS